MPTAIADRPNRPRAAAGLTATTLSTAALALTAAVATTLAPAPAAHAGTLGAANVLVFNDFHATSSDVQGRLYAGGNVSISSYSVGDQLDAGAIGTDVLIAGGDFTFGGGRVYYGNAVYGGSLSKVSWATVDGSLTQGNPFDFNAAYARYRTASTQLGQLGANGTATVQWGGLTLAGAEAGLNVFNVDASVLSAIHTLNFDIPDGATALVNVSGTNAGMQNFGMFGNEADKTLFNFQDAQSLHLSGIGVVGSILAVDADITWGSGVVHGQVVADSWNGNGQVNLVDFTPTLPVSFSGGGNSIPTPTAAGAGLLGLAVLLRRRRG